MESATRNFQKKNSLEPDGIIGRQTWEVLLKNSRYSPAEDRIIWYTDSRVRATKTALPSAIHCGGRLLSYTYDGNGNITKIVERDTAAEGGTTRTITYQYDELNQLIHENNQVLDKTVTYEYDLGGNQVEYVGRTNDPDKRQKEHERDLRKNIYKS